MIESLPWPLAAIDFEASSLDPGGYPIEAGLAFWPAPDAPVSGWSVLIRPTEAWTRQGHWSPESAKVHGLRGRDLLAAGWPPARVAATLNNAIGSGRVAWCDGGPYDGLWMRALFRAGGVDPGFVLNDWHRLLAILGKTARDKALDWLEGAPAKHRARPDAEQLLLAVAYAAGCGHVPVVDFDPDKPLAITTKAMRT
jgi:hypothetical protein